MERKIFLKNHRGFFHKKAKSFKDKTQLSFPSKNLFYTKPHEFFDFRDRKHILPAYVYRNKNNQTVRDCTKNQSFGHLSPYIITLFIQNDR